MENEIRVGVVRVRQSSPNTWYSELVQTNSYFWVVMIPGSSMIWFNGVLFFYPQDVEVVTDEEKIKEAIVPSYLVGGIA